MSTLDLIPDAEAVVGGYLRAHPDLEALGVRVAGAVPESQVLPWVKLTQLDGRDTGDLDYFINYLLQFDCYAGVNAMRAHSGQAEAWLTARTVRAALTALQGQTLDDSDGKVAVTEVTFSSMARVPDLGYEPARERIILDAQVFAHRT